MLKSTIMHFIIIGLFSSVMLGSSTTISELKSPDTNTVDFTFNSVNKTSSSYSTGTIVDKVSYELNSLQKLFPRLFKVSSCEKDSYNTLYCPDALVRADEYWGYDQSEVIAKKQTVIDFEQGTYQELTSTVRDFMDGFASSHNSNVTDYQSGWGTANVGTVVDYQSNSTASTYTGSVVDYTSKVSSGVTLSENSYTPVLQKPLKNNTQNNQVIVGFEHRSTGNTGHNVSPFTTAGVVQMNGEAVDYSGLSGYSRSGWGWSSSVNMFNITKPASIEGMPTLVYDQNLIGGDDGIATCSSFSNSILEPTLNSLMSNKYLIVMYKIGTTEKVSGGYWENGQCKVNVKAYQATTVSNSGYFIIKGIQVTGRGYITKNIVADNINVYTSGGKFYLNGVQFTGPVVGGYFNDVYITVDFQYVGDIAYNACPGTDMLFSGKCVSQHLTSSPPSCPDTYQDNGTNCKKTVNYNYYSYGCPSTYTPVNSGFTSYTKSDPDTSNINDYTLDDAVNSSTPPASNCKKTITYSYYNYNCPADYTKASNGLTMCSKTDPNNTTNDESNLSQACNNSTPPTGNCTKIIPYTYYSYECSTGYTAIDKGLAACSKTDSSTTADNSGTLAQSCNSATAPKENCYKDVSYKYYSYGCSAGYITDNYGLSTCPKTDPNKSINNSATLDDACNSATPPPGNCQKPIEFSYFQYICTGTNAFGETYSPINPGLNSCNKTDPNNITVNGTTLDDACNSSTPPVNNCQATEYTCNSNIIKPALVDGKWQCSPYVCNSEQKCGTATCNDYPPSKEFFMEESLLPMKPDYNGSCIGVLCDITMNKNISYCDAGETCPKINGVYTKNGKCYYDDCPQGSFVDANGNCVVE